MRKTKQFYDEYVKNKAILQQVAPKTGEKQVIISYFGSTLLSKKTCEEQKKFISYLEIASGSKNCSFWPILADLGKS